MTSIIKTKLAEKAEQFEIDGVHYVGRRVLEEDGECVWRDTKDDFILFRLDYDRGDVFVDPAILRPYPETPIEEPGT